MSGASRTRAQSAVSAAVASGKLPSPSACEACGVAAEDRSAPGGKSRSTIYYHHPQASYQPDKWLDVIPLCGSCHRKVHSGAIVEPRTGLTWPRMSRHDGTYEQFPSDSPIAHFPVPQATHDRVLLLHRQRERENPHRRVSLAEVWREVVAAGLDTVAPLPAVEVK